MKRPTEDTAIALVMAEHNINWMEDWTVVCCWLLMHGWKMGQIGQLVGITQQGVSWIINTAIKRMDE